MLLFLVASDFFSSSVIAGVGAVEHLSDLCSFFSPAPFFSPARDFFPSFYPLLLLSVSVSLILIIIMYLPPVFIFTSSSFPSALCSFPGHSFPLCHLFQPVIQGNFFNLFCNCNCSPVMTNARMSLREPGMGRSHWNKLASSSGMGRCACNSICQWCSGTSLFLPSQCALGNTRGKVTHSGSRAGAKGKTNNMN